MATGVNGEPPGILRPVGEGVGKDGIICGGTVAKAKDGCQETAVSIQPHDHRVRLPRHQRGVAGKLIGRYLCTIFDR